MMGKSAKKKKPTEQQQWDHHIHYVLFCRCATRVNKPATTNCAIMLSQNPLSWAKRGRFFWLFFIQFYLCRITYWAPLELQDYILSTTGDADLVAGLHTEHHWRCLLTCRITYWALLEMLTYLLTYFLCLDPRNKRKDGWPGSEERGGPWDTEKCSIHWPGYSTSHRERERERERERVIRAAASFEAWEKRGGGAMALTSLLVAATRNPNGVQKSLEW